MEELYNIGLLGKLLADRSINKNAVKAIILKAWRTSRGVQIVDLRENVFLFIFACEGDKRRIVVLGPWNIEGFPLILKAMESEYGGGRFRLLKPTDLDPGT